MALPGSRPIIPAGRLSTLGNAVAVGAQSVVTDGTWRYYLGFAIGRMSGFAVLPVLSRILGVSGFGQFEAALAALMAATIVVDSGMAAALVRYVGDPFYDRRSLLSGAARLQVRASALAVLVFGPLVVFFAPSGAGLLVAVGALLIFAVIEGLAGLGSGYCRATQRDGLYLGLSVVRLLTTVAATLLGAALLGTGGALLGIALGGTGFAVYAAIQIHRAHGPVIPSVQSKLARYGFPLVATTAMTWSLGVSDRLFLQRSADASVVGAYSANYRLGSLVLLFLSTPMAMTWVPAARRAAARGDLSITIRRWLTTFTVASLCLVGGLSLTAPFLVPLFFGTAFEGDQTVVFLVSISGWLGGLYYFAATPLLIGNDTRVLVAVSVIVVLLNLLLNSLLIPVHLANGAAVATLLSYLALCVTTWALAARAS